MTSLAAALDVSEMGSNWKDVAQRDDDHDDDDGLYYTMWMAHTELGSLFNEIVYREQYTLTGKYIKFSRHRVWAGMPMKTQLND